MLKGIDPLLSGALLKVLDEAGHGDRIVIADRNFPAYSQNAPVLRLEADAEAAFEAIFSVFPLDTFVEHPIARMGPDDRPEFATQRQQDLLDIASRHHDVPLEFEAIARMSFYDRANGAFAIIQTLESAPYCDFILTKGVI